RFFSPVQRDRSAALEGVIFFQELADFGNQVFHANLEERVDLLGRLQISEQDAISESRSVLLVELINIFLRQKQFVVIQILQIGFQNTLRHFGVEFLSAIMALLKESTDRDSDLARVSRVGLVLPK